LKKLLMTLTAVLALALAACGPGGDSGSPGTSPGTTNLGSPDGTGLDSPGATDLMSPGASDGGDASASPSM
jgi:hypothetical protein